MIRTLTGPVATPFLCHQLLGAGDRSVSDRTPSRTSNLDSPAPFFYLIFLVAHTSMAMSLGTLSSSRPAGGTDALSQPLEPLARPGEFEPKNGQSNWDHDNRGAWHDNHHDAECKNGNADNSHCYSSRQPESNIKSAHSTNVDRPGPQ